MNPVDPQWKQTANYWNCNSQKWYLMAAPQVIEKKVEAGTIEFS